ncbi:MAG: DUF3604 domain-containing protein [Myxococcales bacterium]|nr:DUF3604 domain-containing protein [Myxococcales bacterium]
MAKEPTRLYWGDTHLHTSYSADAYFLGNRSAGPDTAYRWAQGLPVVHPSTQSRVQIRTPLDFLVVADHAEMLTVPERLMNGDPKLSNTPTGRKWIEMMGAGKGAQIFEYEFGAAINSNTPIADFDTESIKGAAWGDVVQAAERHYAPCSFTSFIGWEWTSTPNGNNLHRVVFMPDGEEKARAFLPFSSFDSDKPEDLWAWLEETSERVGTDFVAIPHNSNISGGLMFDEMDSEGRPITAEYARMRMRWEPVVEVTQIKGDSETHPKLSPNDELAGFETFSHLLKVGGGQAEVSEGDYVRSSLQRGMQIDQNVGANPYKFGMIGSTDSHTGLASAEESNFWGKFAIDSTPETTFVEIAAGLSGADMSASGLAAVWAEENTRMSLFAAFKRKEVYATTGPRIRVRFFGGWHFKSKNAQQPGMVNIGYTYGHPMGSDLTKAPEDEAPKFLMYAVKDPAGANLDRMQIVKGWVDAGGQAHEKVYDVALAGARQYDEQGRALPIASTVDLKTGKYHNVFGAPSLSAYWEDPDFDRTQRAFYYLRVVQIPTPRHTLSDAIALGMDPNDTGHPSVIQERAYSSPIWYTP